MKTKLLLAICAAALILSPDPAFARLGESPEECDKRYGKPVSEGKNYRAYQKGDISISITIHEGKAERVSFFSKTVGLTRKEIMLLLKANSAGNKSGWKIVDTEGKISQMFESGDGSLFAIYYKETRHLLIATQALVDRGSKKDVERLEGF